MSTQTETTTTPCPGQIEPQKEHHWLQKFVGQWTGEGEATMEPGKPPTKWESVETVRSLGGLWILAEGKGEMPGGGEATTLMTIGYDPVKKQFVGSFIGSMMANMWIYEGNLDSTGKILTLDTEGPSMAPGGKIAKYQDIIELKNDDHRVLTSQMLGDDGQWHRFMTANYRRKK
jgi:hypothetical protein